MWIAILSLLAALVPLLMWWAKSHYAPTPEQKIANTESDYDALTRELQAAEDAGDFATADALLRRLRTLHEPEAKHDDGTAG